MTTDCRADRREPRRPFQVTRSRPPRAASLRRQAGVAGLLALLILFLSCRRNHGVPDACSDGGYNLLILTMDTTRADHLGVYGRKNADTPNLDWLAHEGVMFSNCRTSVPLTLPAHCTLFTGREPPGHQVRVNGTYALRREETTLAEMMRNAGFGTQAVISSFVLEGKFGLSQGFENYDDALDISKSRVNYSSEIPADQVFAKFKRWLDKRREGRFFCWLHFYDPHDPYNPPRHWAERLPGSPYDGEIAFMDENIGHVIEALKERDWLKKTVIVAVADHGEGFGEHAESGHGIFCYEETLHVPLIVYQPRLFPGGRVVSGNVGLVDVLPTLAEMFRLPLPDGVQGRSFARQLAGDPPPPERGGYFESMHGMEDLGWAPLTGLRRGTLTYISLPRPELYDLGTDPGEKENIYLKRNAVARKMARELRERLPRITNKNRAIRRQLTGQDQEQLRALGYLASNEPLHPAGPGADDPKQGILLMNRFNRIHAHIENREFAEAQRELAEMKAAGLNKTSMLYYDRRYDLCFAQNDFQSAQSILREAIELYPATVRFKYLLAVICEKRGDAPAAEALAREVVSREPLFTQAHTLLFKIYREKGLFQEAKTHIRQAIAQEPRNNWLKLELANLLFDLGDLAAVKATIEPMLNDATMLSTTGVESLHREIAALLIKLGESRRARSILESVTRDEEKDAEAWTQLGLSQISESAREQAMVSLQKALSLAPEKSLALSGIGTIYLDDFLRLKSPESLRLAEEYYRRARTIDPLLVTAINGLGVIHLYRGDLSQAMAEWREVIRIDPTFVNAYFNLALIEMKTGHQREARRFLEMLRSRNSSRLSAVEKTQLSDLLDESGR
jgi:choline-sulfatase